LGLGLSYSSLVWTKSGPYLYFDEDISQISPGFHLGFAAVQGPHYDGLVGQKVYLLVTSAGRRVELRQVSLSNVFQSADSAYLQLVENSDGTLTLRTTDGTQISYSPYANDWQATQIKDRNGNYLTVENDWRGDISVITDTLGRQLHFGTDGNGNLLSIIEWRDGGWQTWATFGWDTPLTMNVSGMSGVVGTFQGESIPVLRRVALPDGSYYTFEYNGVGQITGIANYSFDNTTQNYTTYDYDGATTDCPRVSQSHLSGYNWTGIPGMPATVTTVFNLPGDGSHEMVTPDGTKYREYYGTGWQNGLVTQTQVYAPGLQKWTTTTYDQDNTGVNYQLNPRVTETTVNDSSGNHRRTTIDYDGYVTWGLPHVIHEYDGGGTELRRTYNTYELSQPYINNRIIGLVSERDLYDPAQGWQSRTTFYYDSNSISAQATYAPQHDQSYSSTGITVRGNLTHVNRWDASDFGNPYKILTTQMAYDAAGSLSSTTDPAGHTSSIGYSDSFSDGNNGRGTYAYPTTLTDADNYSSYVQYDYALGAKSRVEGPPPGYAGQYQHGLIQTFYYDAAARLYEIHDGNNTPIIHTNYGPGYTQTWSSVNSQQDNYSFQSFDGLGRVIARGGYHPGSAGGYQNQRMRYDQMGRLVQQTNPTEMTGFWVPYGDDSAWQFNNPTEYDWKGRPIHVYNMDGSYKTFEYAGCGCAGGEVVTLTDEMGRQQRVYSDSLGRQSKTEIMNGNSVYSTTTKTFNARDQVTLVRQTDNTTSAYQDTPMGYDGYGRLASKHVPEQRDQIGNPTYTTFTHYDDDTIHTVTDARGAVTTYLYNGRHQITSATSALSGQPTISSTFEYDAVGNRTSMTDGMGSTSYIYDSLSRMTSETRILSGLGSYTIGYGYNLAGEMTSVTDPFNSTISYGYDAAGRTSSVTGTSFGGVTTYASNMQYRAFDGLKSMSYGNSKTLAVGYDTRMAPSSYEVPGIIKRSYQRNNDGSMDFSQDQLITNSKFDRKYTYDPVGRVATGLSGAEARGSAATDDRPYNETLGYDAFDHLTTRTVRQWNRDVSSGTETFVNNRISFWHYDGDGRVTISDVGTYVYDAAGEIVSFGDSAPNMTDQTMDGDGRRVKSVQRHYDEATDQWVTDSTTYYVNSSVLGNLLTEITAAGTKQQTYVYANGAVLAEQTNFGGSASVTWEHRDPGGASVRVTDAAAQPAGLSGELDVLGANAGVIKPITWPTPRSTGELVPFRGLPEMSSSGGCAQGGVYGPCGYSFWGSSIADLPGFGTNWGSFGDLTEWLYTRDVARIFAEKKSKPKTPPTLKPFNSPRHPYRPFDPNIEQPIHGSTDDWILTPQNPTPFDQLLDRARQLHNQPNRNDCLALVDLIRTSAKLFPNVISATSALGDVLTGSSSAYELAIRNAANDMSNPMVTFGNNGFQTSFAGDPGDNQVRHFMGGLLVGATLGAANGLPRMNARENPNIPGDVADINLNGVSVPLGDSLRTHNAEYGLNPGLVQGEKLNWLADQVRDKVCK